MNKLAHVPVSIPTNQSFLSQWHPWVQLQVNRRFKRDKERSYDVAQDVRVRLLAKDFIARWFFKHLSGELVDRPQAERILGGAQITFIGQLSPVEGRRSSPDSLWLVSDLLKFARFDYERYYYSIQKHTLDSDKVLRLIGYQPGEYGALESLYRQGRLKPSELTEHRCTELNEAAVSVDGLCSLCPRPHYSRGYCSSCYRKARVQRCAECDKGRESLKERGLSLVHRWTDPSVATVVSKLRWNDDQLRPFLRAWRRTNMVRTSPLYIMRNSAKPGIDAGLLKYAKIIIDNEVNNSFKRMSRADDMSTGVFNNGLSGEFSNDETFVMEGEHDSEEGQTRVFRDPSSTRAFSAAEDRMDMVRLMAGAGVDDDELEALVDLDALDVSAKDHAERQDVPVQKVHRNRASAIRKLRSQDSVAGDIVRLVSDAAAEHGCTPAEVLGGVPFGRPVLARTAVVVRLHDRGLGVEAISSALSLPEERVVAALNRAVLRDTRMSAAGA